MTATAAVDPRPDPTTERMVADLEETRARTLALVAHLPTADLERQIDPILSPLVWDLGHIAAFEDLWCVHRRDGRPVLHPELAGLYDAFETPREVRGDVAILDHAGSLAYLDAVRARTLQAIATHAVDGVVHEMVLRHELQHSETMRQAMALADLLPPADGPPPALADERGDPWLAVPAGAFAMGAAPDGFAYDNERPRRAVELPGFRITRRPVTNEAWRAFADAGGYERRAWWTEEGWAWCRAQAPERHAAVADRAPAAAGRPVMHVSWFEADAYARSVGARLPTEAEWEKAAASPALEGVGRVWEWTASEFTAYPGFVAHPYREYSEVFFDQGLRVLRGGSWATHPRVATRTFRNWDLPQRSQIFSGVRLAGVDDPPPPATPGS